MKYSFSAFDLFDRCQRSFFYKYIERAKKSDEVEDKWGAFGKVCHSSLENREQFKSAKEAVNHYWVENNLGDRMNVQDAYESVEYGEQIGEMYPSLHNEFELIFPFIGNEIHIIVDRITINKQILDWKTSTFEQSKVEEYRRQILFYSWALYRAKNEFYNEGVLAFIKPQKGVKRQIPPFVFSFTKEKLEEFEKDFVINKIKKIDNKKEFKNFIKSSDKKSCFFCPYKLKCANDDMKERKEIRLNIIFSNKDIFIETKPLDMIFEKVLDDKFKYKMDGAYYAIKFMRSKGNKEFDGVIHLYKNHKLPIGFKNKLGEITKEYSEYLYQKGKRLIINETDIRKYPNQRMNIKLPKLIGKVPRDYQKETADKIIEDKISLNGLCTGAGKTLIAAEVIRRLDFKTLFVVDVIALGTQAMKTFNSLLKIKCGIVMEGKQNWNNTVNVCSIQTIVKLINKKDKTFLRELQSCNVIIVDEAHSAKSKSYKKLMDNICAEYRIGLSGTPYSDGNDSLELYRSFGEPKNLITTKELIDKGYLMQPKIFFIKYDIPENFILGDYSDVFEQIVSSKERMEELKKIALERKDDFNFIMIRRLKDAEQVKEILDSLNLESKIITGSVKKRDEIFDMMHEGKLHFIIATDKIIQKGIDIPRANSFINVSANLGSIASIQSLGRILRQAKELGKTEAYYYDFFDDVEFLRKHTLERIETFNKSGHIVEYISTKREDL